MAGVCVMNKPCVVACFVIYSGEDIAYQGTFQVSQETNLCSHQSTNGGEFGFRHCYKARQCNIEVSYSKSGIVQAQLKLEIPINRTKIKWKKSTLGENYDVRYRCVFELAETSRKKSGTDQNEPSATFRHS